MRVTDHGGSFVRIECACKARMRLLALIEKPERRAARPAPLGIRDHPPPITPARLDDEEHAA